MKKIRIAIILWILWWGILSNTANALVGTTLSWIMQRNGYGGKLFNQKDDAIIVRGSNTNFSPTWNWWKLTAYKYDYTNDFWLEPLGDFKRGIKAFEVDWDRARPVSPDSYHYSAYNWTQEWDHQGYYYTRSSWEAGKGKYNLYDSKWNKWWDCTPTYYEGTMYNSMFHNGRNGWYYSVATNSRNNSDPFTQALYSDVARNTEGINTNDKVMTINNKFVNDWNYSSRLLGHFSQHAYGATIYLPYVVNEHGERINRINLVTNSWHLNWLLNPEEAQFKFMFGRS